MLNIFKKVVLWMTAIALVCGVTLFTSCDDDDDDEDETSVFTTNLSDKTAAVGGDAVALTVAVSKTDEQAVEYAWYSATEKKNPTASLDESNNLVVKAGGEDYGTVIAGAETATYSVATDSTSEKYYFCVVAIGTKSEGSWTAAPALYVSNVAKVTISEATTDPDDGDEGDDEEPVVTPVSITAVTATGDGVAANETDEGVDYDVTVDADGSGVEITLDCTVAGDDADKSKVAYTVTSADTGVGKSGVLTVTESKFTVPAAHSTTDKLITVVATYDSDNTKTKTIKIQVVAKAADDSTTDASE